MRKLWHALCVFGGLFLIFQAAPAAAAAAEPATAAQRCLQLANLDFAVVKDAPAQVTEARIEPAQGGAPAYCQVTGYVWSQVGFQLDLPLDGWNEKFLESGCGGFCGRVMDWYCRSPVAHGYACIATDLGHRSNAGNPLAASFSALWAFNDLQAQVDHGFRGAHVVVIAGRAIAERFYGKSPRLSYFVGCSDGGREALNEAQKFPGDFDGIVAGAPANNYAAIFAAQVWNDRLAFTADHKPVFDAAAIKLVMAAVLAACDRDDGLKDGLIGDPRQCRFDPVKLECKTGASGNCLTAAQVGALRKLYSGPVTAGGKPFMPAGVSPAMSLWSLYAPGSQGRTRAASYAEEFLRYFGLSPAPGPGWSLADFDPVRDYDRLAVADALMSATNPDLRRFQAKGGKLILYHGWDDSLISPMNTIDYYEAVERQMGGAESTQAFARLFMVPGMDHCALGPGAWDIDYLSAIDSWVDGGTAPAKLVGANVTLPPDPAGILAMIGSFPIDPAQIAFTRPIYPYPIRAKYKGGDPKSETSFVPAR